MKFLTMVAVILALAACSSDESAQREPTVGKEIADDYNAMQAKAEAVGDQLEQQKEDLDAAIEESEDDN